MRLHRRLLALALATTMGLATGCAQEPDDTAAPAGSAAATSGAATPSPTVDLKANTEAVCAAVKAAADMEKEAMLEVFGEMLTATADGDKAAQAEALAKGEAIVARFKKAVDAELVKAADPAAKAAIERFVAAFAALLRPENTGNAAMKAEVEKVEAEVKKYCPTLTR